VIQGKLFFMVEFYSFLRPHSPLLLVGAGATARAGFSSAPDVSRLIAQAGPPSGSHLRGRFSTSRRLPFAFPRSLPRR